MMENNQTQGEATKAATALVAELRTGRQLEKNSDEVREVLYALVSELVEISRTEGFLTTDNELTMTRSRSLFNEKNRNLRAIEIGNLISEIAGFETVEDDGKCLDGPELMSLLYNEVQRQAGYSGDATELNFAWDGIAGWLP